MSGFNEHNSVALLNYETFFVCHSQNTVFADNAEKHFSGKKLEPISSLAPIASVGFENFALYQSAENIEQAEIRVVLRNP